MAAAVACFIDNELLSCALREAASSQEQRDVHQPLIAVGMVGAMNSNHQLDSHLQQEGTMGPEELAEAALKADSLSLSYRGIHLIDSLQGFSNLTKLCLDNNSIEKIENLNHLKKLRWLDLSFNKIQKIEGLESLTELEDLTLFSNQIESTEGWLGCAKLQCLSLGNNRMTTLDNVLNLRRFKRLEMLNLQGNPLCSESDYKFTVLAFLPSLKYFDYSMTDSNEVAQAKEQYQDELLELQEKEALEEEKWTREENVRMEEERLKKANLLVTKTLAADMLAADTEMVKLQHLPRINQLVEKLKSHISASAEALASAGLLKDRQKDDNMRLFESARGDITKSHASQSVALIKAFEKEKKRAIADIESLGGATSLADLQNELDGLEVQLMDQEMYQVEQQEELINEYEATIGEIRNQCYELQQAFFRACESHEEEYFNAVGMLAQDMLEKAARNELLEDIPDELSNLLIDRDTCMNSVVGSHDIHVGKILSSEDEVRAEEARQMQDRVDMARHHELKRNRARVMEITRFVASNRRQLEVLLASRSRSLDDSQADEHSVLSL